MMATSYEQEIEKSGRIIFTINGVSMRPLFRTATDAIFVKKIPDEKLKNLDIVLFKRGAQYVLHRIVDKRPDGCFVIAGDNCSGADMHGAVVAVGERAWLFTAASGTGKTTHIRLWLENIEGSYVVNGDKPLIHIGEKMTVYGTPWAGKEGMQKNVGVKLCGIVFLERGRENRIERVAFSRALPTLIQQSYRPNDKTSLEKTLGLIGRLGSSLPLYRLQYNMLPEVAFTAYEKLNTDTD